MRSDRKKERQRRAAPRNADQGVLQNSTWPTLPCEPWRVRIGSVAKHCLCSSRAFRPRSIVFLRSRNLTHSLVNQVFAEASIHATDEARLISLPIEFRATGTPPTAIGQFIPTKRHLPLVSRHFCHHSVLSVAWKGGRRSRKVAKGNFRPPSGLMQTTTKLQHWLDLMRKGDDQARPARYRSDVKNRQRQTGAPSKCPVNGPVFGAPEARARPAQRRGQRTVTTVRPTGRRSGRPKNHSEAAETTRQSSV